MLVERTPVQRAHPFTPRFDGPFRVTGIPDPHGVLLADVVTGEPVFEGRRVAIQRILNFFFPHAVDYKDTNFQTPRVRDLVPGDFLAFDMKGKFLPGDLVLGEFQSFADGYCLVEVYAVPYGARKGPWASRVWELQGQRQEIAAERMLCRVELETHGGLTMQSLEAMRAAGVRVY